MTEPRNTLYDIQMRVADVAYRMMKRGVQTDRKRVQALKREVYAMMEERQRIVEDVLGHPLERNKAGHLPFFNSNPQMHAFFTARGLKGKRKRGAKSPSYDDDALHTLGKKDPSLTAFCNAVIEYRSLGDALSTFLLAECEPGGRLRTTFNTASAETFRWTSSTNPFYRGCNIQNIGGAVHKTTACALPNYRTAIIPDEGMMLLEPDLKGADAQVVAWDSGDIVLKDMCKQGVKIAAERAKMIFNGDAGPDGRREPYYTNAKSAGHGWTYGGKARTLAATCGVTQHEMDKVLRKLAGIHPGIPKWHRRVEAQLAANRTITNAFGYRIVYFGRVEDSLTKALAWIGQGTVACVINRVLVAMDQELPEVQLLINNHDSFVGQIEPCKWAQAKPLVRAIYERVVVPYPEPLIIPPALKVSTKSWGEMQEEAW
jgi:DNA polymerase I